MSKSNLGGDLRSASLRSASSGVDIAHQILPTTEKGSRTWGSKSGEKQTQTIYEVFLSKDAKNKFGIAYRFVEEHGLIITGIIPNSSADVWNQKCDLADSLCTHDTILVANGHSSERDIVEELVESATVTLEVQKTGPRWHINDEYGNPRERELLLESDFEPRLSAGFAARASTESAKSITSFFSATSERPDDPIDACGVLLIFLAIFIPNCFLLLFFSDIGQGIKTYTSLSKKGQNELGNGIVFVGSVTAVCFIIYDFSRWKSKFKQAAGAVVVTYGFCAGAILKARFYPFAPLVIIAFHIPLSLGILRGKVLRTVKRNHFYVSLTVSAFIVGFGLLTLWLVWMNIESWDGSHRWGDATKESLATASTDMYMNWDVKIRDRTRPLNYWWDCNKDTKQLYDFQRINAFRYMDANWTRSDHLITTEENEVRGKACASIKTIWFLVYSVPLIATSINLVIAVFCLLNGVCISAHDASKMEKVLKQFILMISFLVFLMYVASSVAGASMRLTGVIMAFCFSSMIALCVWLYMEIGRQHIAKQVKSSKLMNSLILIAKSDWARACVLIACNALIPVFLLINRLNQLVRKKRGLVPRDDPAYTPRVLYMILAIRVWNWASILIKANWLVVLYWTFSVGVAKITYVFLSWLNEELLKIPFVWVVVIFFFIGFTMFMLPPVPGIPVYICSGIVLSARARNIPEVGGFWGGMCIAIVESLILKICAVCGQYSLGYFMGKSVKVQQLVSVDKTFTRAIEKILDTRGLNLPKVSVLVGGPDWPTSVLCGILKLNLFQCCLGTLPVIFVSAPCVIAGAFLSNPGKSADDDSRRLAGVTTTISPLPVQKEGDMWNTLSTVAMLCSGMLQLAGMVLALYFIQEIIHRDGEELSQPRPEHEAVAALTRAEADYVTSYNNVLKWSSLRPGKKRLIVSSTVAMLVSTFMFVMMDEACFRQFAVANKISDPYDKDGLNGSVLNLVMPLGWFATGCFFFACFLHWLFLRWANKQALLGLKVIKEHRLQYSSSWVETPSTNPE